MSQWFPVVASAALAFIPVILWLQLIKKEEENEGIYLKTFLIGTLSVALPFALVILFQKYPQLNFYEGINRTIRDVTQAVLMTNIVVALIEEVAKNIIVRVVDKRNPEYLQTIASALKLSICAGLGFSFAENIYYLHHIWTNIGAAIYTYSDLFSTFIFRSFFTTLMHMLASGIFGYHFGLGKFASDLTEYAHWSGSGVKLSIIRFLSKFTGRMNFEVVRELYTLKGLAIAMALHASFNIALTFDHKLYSIVIVAIAAGYVFYLLHTKSGHLLFSIEKRKSSSLAARDEDVVLELIGMWSKEGRYKEVMQICDRLLARDPDNNVVKLFRAKAVDETNIQAVYASFKNLLAKEKGQQPSQNLSAKPLEQKDEQTVLELLDQWYKEGRYKEVLQIAQRLRERNPTSSGAALLMQKAIDKEKLQNVFASLQRIFKTE